MRAELGLAAVSLGLWLVGAAILLASGILSLDRRSLLVWSGAAYLVGTAAVGLVLTVALVAGIGVSSRNVVLAIVAVTVVGVGAWRLRRVPPLPPATQRAGDRFVKIAAAAVFALFLFAGSALALVQPIENWDGWAIWGVKALLLYDHGTIPPQFVTGDYGLSHIDYPLLWPVLEAAHFRVMGGPEPKLATLPQWLLYVSFAGTVAAVGSRLVRPAVWAPAALGTLTSYAILDQTFWHYADVPTGILVGGGALFGGLWLVGQRARWLVPAALLLGAAANGKNEGLMAAIAVVGALAVGAAFVLPAIRRRALLTAGATAAFVALTALPWRLWLSSHDVNGDIKASNALDPGYLADRSERVEPAASTIWDKISATGAFGYIAFCALLLIVVALIRRSTRPLGAYYAVSVALVFLFLMVAYWVAETDLRWHLGTSADRVVMLLAFLGIAAIVHLAAALYEEEP